MKKEHEIRNEINKEINKYHAESDPLIKSIHTDRRITLEWVLGE